MPQRWNSFVSLRNVFSVADRGSQDGGFMKMINIRAVVVSADYSVCWHTNPIFISPRTDLVEGSETRVGGGGGGGYSGGLLFQSGVYTVNRHPRAECHVLFCMDYYAEYICGIACCSCFLFRASLTHTHRKAPAHTVTYKHTHTNTSRTMT